MKRRVRKGKLKFMRGDVDRFAMTKNGGGWRSHPIRVAYKPDALIDQNSPVIGLGETTDDGYTRVLTSAGPLWVRVMDLTESPEPEPNA